MMFGLTQDNINQIVEILRQFPEIESALIFGSRAKGTYKNGSDVDIALRGKQVSHAAVIAVSAKLNEETNMPYHFDVLDYLSIANPDLVLHIDRVGKVIFDSHSPYPMDKLAKDYLIKAK